MNVIVSGQDVWISWALQHKAQDESDAIIVGMTDGRLVTLGTLSRHWI